MRFGVLAGVCLLTGVGVSSAHAQPASIDLVTSAIAALGGEQAMRGLNSLLIQGEAKYSEPEESFAVGRRAFLVTRISRCPGSLPWGGRASLGPALERYGITDATIASGNGGAAKQSDLAAVLAE